VAPDLGLTVARSTIRDLQAYRNAAQQGTVVTRMGARERHAAAEATQLFVELLTDKLVFADRDQNESADIGKEGMEEGKVYAKTSLA
jgi:hypothetical protein